MRAPGASMKTGRSREGVSSKEGEVGGVGEEKRNPTYSLFYALTRSFAP